jgi:membrane protease YdiL (CAAX protease family)
MGDPAALAPLAAVLAAMAVLLVAGLAALLHLLALGRSQPPWTDALQALAARAPWRWSHVGQLLAILFAAQLLRRALPAAPLWDMLCFQGVLLPALLLLARPLRAPFGDPMPWRAAAAQAALRWLAILPILWFAGFAWNLLLLLLGHRPDLQHAVQLFLQTPGFWPRAAFVLFAVVVAPVVEELLFRGILLPLLVRRAGPAPGLALASAAFAALHADLAAFPALAILAAALSLAYARTRSLAVPIALHVAFNAANLLLLLGLQRAGALGP